MSQKVVYIKLCQYNIINDIPFLELSSELQKFIDKSSIEFYDRQTVDAIDCIKNETIEVEDIVKYWEKAFKEVMYTFFFHQYNLYYTLYYLGNLLFY